MQLMKAAKKITALAVAFTFAFSPTQFSFAADNFTVQDGQSVPVPTQDAESFESKTTDDFDFRDVQNDLPNTESQTEGSVVITPVDQSSSEMIAQDSASQGQDNTTTTETETVVASLPSEADTSETITRAEDFVANAEDTNTTTETQTADTKGELSTYNLDDIHHRATEILEQAPDAEKTTVVSSRVECAMAGPGCGQMAHSFTFYNSNGEPLGRLEQNPNFQVQTSDPVETWYNANNNPIDILDTNSTENIPVTDKIEKSLGEVVLGVAPIIYKIVEVADSTCLSMDCPIGATTTRYVDASGKPLGSKSEITYRNNTATLVSLEGNASGTADASETRTVVTWRDKDGAEIRFVYGTVESDTFVIERGNYFYAIKRNEDGTYASSPALKQHVLSEGDHGVTEVLGVPAYSHQESTGEIACNWSGCSGTTVVETAYYSQTGVHLGLLREKYDAASGKISFEFFDANGNLVPDNSAWNLEKQEAAKNLKIDASLIDHKMTVQQPICDGPSCPTDSTLTQYFDKDNRLLGSKEVTTYVDGINLVDNSGKIELFSEAPSELRLVIVWRDANGNEIKPDEQKLPLSEIVANFNPPLSAETQAQVDAALQDMIDPSSYTIEKDVFETVIGYTWVSRTDNTKSYHLTVWRDAEDNAHWDFTISMPIQQAVFSQAQIDQLMVQLEAQMPQGTYLRKVEATIGGKPAFILQVMRGQPTDTFAGSNMAGSIYIFKNADGSYDSKANLYGPSSLIQAQMIPYLVNANVALKGEYSADQQKLIQLFRTVPTLAVISRDDVRLGYAEIIEGTEEARLASQKLEADIVFSDEGMIGCELGAVNCTPSSFKLYYSRDGKLAGKL